MCRYKIEILCNKESKDYFELIQLIEKFATTVFLIQKYNLHNISSNEKRKFLKEHEKEMMQDEIDFIANDVKMRKDYLDSSFNDSKIKTRYFLIKDKNKVIGFQTAQIRKNNDTIIEGWRNYAYILPEFSGQVDYIIDINGETKFSLLSNVLYENITEWFISENVELERTATGKNMYKNILAYMCHKGFEIEKTDERRVFLIKDYNKLKNKKDLKEEYKNYLKNSSKF